MFRHRLLRRVWTEWVCVIWKHYWQKYASFLKGVYRNPLKNTYCHTQLSHFAANEVFKNVVHWNPSSIRDRFDMRKWQTNCTFLLYSPIYSPNEKEQFKHGIFFQTLSRLVKDISAFRWKEEGRRGFSFQSESNTSLSGGYLQLGFHVFRNALRR